MEKEKERNKKRKRPRGAFQPSPKEAHGPTELYPEVVPSLSSLSLTDERGPPIIFHIWIKSSPCTAASLAIHRIMPLPKTLTPLQDNSLYK
jgi:hypothetical protein